MGWIFGDSALCGVTSVGKDLDFKQPSPKKAFWCFFWWEHHLFWGDSALSGVTSVGRDGDFGEITPKRGFFGGNAAFFGGTLLSVR